MHETPEDLVRLQRLLDASYAAAGPYLSAVLPDARRLAAAEVVTALGSLRVMALATTTARGEPRVAPVDGLFHRGRLHFYSGPESLRFRHLRDRPGVSASVIEGERLQITVHGRAHEVSPADEPELESFLIGVYGQESWDRSRSAMRWARIEPDRMLTYYDPTVN